jgi:hypothetical protein
VEAPVSNGKEEIQQMACDAKEKIEEIASDGIPSEQEGKEEEEEEEEEDEENDFNSQSITPGSAQLECRDPFLRNRVHASAVNSLQILHSSEDTK